MGIVDNNYRIGGLVGYASFSDIYNSFAVGETIGDSEVGGLVGNSTFSNIYYSYADVDVSANDTA